MGGRSSFVRLYAQRKARRISVTLDRPKCSKRVDVVIRLSSGENPCWKRGFAQRPPSRLPRQPGGTERRSCIASSARRELPGVFLPWLCCSPYCDQAGFKASKPEPT